MASNLLLKRLRSPIPITVCRGTYNEREVPRANGRAAAGSTVDLLGYTLFFRNTISGAVILNIYRGNVAISEFFRRDFRTEECKIGRARCRAR